MPGLTAHCFPQLAGHRGVLLVASSLVLLTLANAPAEAQVAYVYRASMSGAQVVPPTQSQGVGELEGTFDGGSYWCWGSADHILQGGTFYTGLAGTPTGCHIHRGGAGVNGERLYTLFPGWFPRFASFTIAIDPADCGDLDASELYVVITTDLFPEGEVRGPIIPLLVGPVDDTTWGHIKAQYRE